MPDDLRYCLMRRLTPGNQKKVSQKLAELLQLTTNELLKNFPKFNGSWAKETMALQVNLHEWLANRDDEQAKELRKKFSELPPSLTLREYATLREVDAEPLTPAAKALTQRLPAEWRNRIFPHGIPLLGLKPGVVFASIVPLAILLAGLFAPFRPATQTKDSIIRQDPKEELLEVVLKTSPKPTPQPDVSPTPATEYGGIRLDFDVPDLATKGNKSQAQPLLSVRLQDQKSQRISSYTLPISSPIINKLALGKYRVLDARTTLTERGTFSFKCAEVQIIAGKITPVNCGLGTTLMPVYGDCFSPQAIITIEEKSVPAGTEIPLSANVQKGVERDRNLSSFWTSYRLRNSVLSFQWTASAGKIRSSGFNRYNEMFVLDTTGVAPGTSITLNLRVTDANSKCSASAQTTIVIEKPYEANATQQSNMAQQSIVMPNVVGREYTAARQQLDALGLKLQVTPQYNEDATGKLDTVIRQSPESGVPLKPGQEVILVVIKPTTNASPVQGPSRNCYSVRINRIEVLDTGSGSSEIWGFNITANGSDIVTLPETNYYEGKEAQPSGGRIWCSQAGQETEFVVTGTRPNKKDPKERTATGNQKAALTSNSFNLSIPVTAPNPTDGKFIVHLSFAPPPIPASGRKK